MYSLFFWAFEVKEGSIYGMIPAALLFEFGSIFHSNSNQMMER